MAFHVARGSFRESGGFLRSRSTNFSANHRSSIRTSMSPRPFLTRHSGFNIWCRNPEKPSSRKLLSRAQPQNLLQYRKTIPQHTHNACSRERGERGAPTRYTPRPSAPIDAAAPPPAAPPLPPTRVRDRLTGVAAAAFLRDSALFPHRRGKQKPGHRIGYAPV